MAKKLGIILILGLGREYDQEGEAQGPISISGKDKTAEAKAIAADLETALRQKGIEKEQVKIAPIFYHKILGESEARIIGRLKTSEAHLAMKSAREAMLAAFADATSYLNRAKDPNSAYAKVHAYIQETLRQEFDEKSDWTFVVLAGSLGCAIISNYIWDANLENNKNPESIWKYTTPGPDVALQNLGLMISWGCNLPLFLAGEAVPKNFKPFDENFEWFNFYDKDDILGWPLSILKDSKAGKYSFGYVKDREIVVKGGALPLVHEKYWDKEIKKVDGIVSDKKMAEIVTELIADYWEKVNKKTPFA